MKIVTRESIKMNISELEKEIIDYAKAYYLGQPVITDQQFDALVEELRTADPDNSLLSTVGWGARYGEKSLLSFDFVKSLPKIKKVEDYNTVGKVWLTPKIDGMSAFIEYDENCNIKLMATREGVIITPKALYINAIPLTSVVPNTIIRGEIFVPITDFNKYLADDFANPRNAVSGIINRKSFDLLEYTHFIVHSNVRGHVEPKHYICGQLSDFSDSVIRSMYDHVTLTGYFPIDGIVINGEVAYKIETEEVEATVAFVEWNLTDRKQMVPTIVLQDGIRLYGTKVKRATGLHAKWVMENKVGPGAVVTVTKANEIIPQIVSVKQPAPEGCYGLPAQCPQCQSTLEWDGVGLFCKEANCNYKFSLLSFMKTNFQDEGIKNSEQIVKALSINTFEDILTVRQLPQDYLVMSLLEHSSSIGSAKANAIADLIKNNKIRKSTFLQSLGIRSIGPVASKKAAPFLYKLEYSLYAFLSVIQPTQPVFNAVKANFDLIRKVYLLFKDLLIDDNVNDLLTSKVSKAMSITVVLTGKMSQDRAAIKAHLEQCGVSVVDAIRKGVDYLVQADPSSSTTKTKAAKSLGIAIISEDQLMKLIDNR